jgi:hypothetical protein
MENPEAYERARKRVEAKINQQRTDDLERNEQRGASFLE